MPTEVNYDFSALALNAPATPPAGLAQRFNAGRIVDPGFAANAVSAQIGAVWENNNTFTGNVVKVEAVMASDDAYTSAGAGQFAGTVIIDTAGNAATLGVVKSAIAGNGNIAVSKLVNSAGSVATENSSVMRPTTSNLYSANEFGNNAKITQYHDRIKGIVYNFINNTVWPTRFLIGTGLTSSAFKYGVQSAASNTSIVANTIKSLKVTDDVSSMPLHIAFDQVTAAALASDTVHLGYVSSGAVYAGRYMDIPMNLVFSRNGRLNFRVPSIINLVDCTLPVDPGNSGIFYRNSFKFWNQTEMADIRHAAPYPRFIQASGISASVTTTALWTGAAFNTSYNTLVGRSLPVGSVLFYNPNGVGAISVNAGTGAITSGTAAGTTPFYVWDATDKRVRRFDVTFAANNFSSMVRNQTTLLTVWEADVDVWVESEQYAITIGSGTNTIYSTNAEINIFRSGAWLGWARNATAGSRQVLAGDIIKLRMKTAKTSDTLRTVSYTITNGAGFTAGLTWTTRTKVDLTLYRPSNSKTPKQQIVDMVNAKNGTSLTLADVDVSIAASTDLFESGDVVATLTSKPNRPYTGNVAVTYQRMPITRFNNASGQLAITVPESTPFVGVIAAINAEYGIKLTASDYVTPSYTPPTTGTQTVTLQIATDSFLFTGTTTILVTVAALTQGTQLTGTSTSMTSHSSRYDAKMVHYNDKIYMYGGYKTAGGSIVDAVYDITAGSWTNKASLNLYYPVVHGGYIYLYNTTNGILDRYDPLTDTTTSLATNTSGAAGLFRTQVLVVGDNIHVVGGRLPAGTAVATHHCYSITSNTWSTLTSLPEPIMEAGGCVVNGEIYIMSGWNATTTSVKTYRYNPVTNAWTTRADIPTAKRFSVAVNFRNWVYLFGGAGTNTIMRYDPQLNTWTQMAQTIPAIRYLMAAAQNNDYVYLFAGLDNAGSETGTMWRIS